MLLALDNPPQSPIPLNRLPAGAREDLVRCKTSVSNISFKSVGWLEFNVAFQHKYGYIRDDQFQVDEYDNSATAVRAWDAHGDVIDAVLLTAVERQPQQTAPHQQSKTHSDRLRCMPSAARHEKSMTDGQTRRGHVKSRASRDFQSRQAVVLYANIPLH